MPGATFGSSDCPLSAGSGGLSGTGAFTTIFDEALNGATAFGVLEPVAQSTRSSGFVAHRPCLIASRKTALAMRRIWLMVVGA